MVKKYNVRHIASTGLAIGALLFATACGDQSANGNEAEGDISIPVGASIEEYQAAFADIEPVTLEMQVTSGSGQAFGGQAYEKLAEDVQEWSDGKVTININWTGSVVPPAEVDDALADGRLDLGLVSFQYEPQVFPITNNVLDIATVDRSSTALVGLAAEQMAMMQVANETPEFFEEFQSKSLTPLLPMNPQGPLGFSCSEPIDSVEDLQGKTILSSSVTQSEQIEALGGTVSSLDWSEMFEGLQRGILDCVSASYVVAQATGIPEIAPYFYIPEDTNFQGGANTTAAGASWDSLPLQVRQVVYDKIWEWARNNQHTVYRHAEDVDRMIQEQGGENTYFDDSVSEGLKAANESILGDRTSLDLYDASDFAARYDEAMEYWVDQAGEYGVVDQGSFGDLTEWYEGDLTQVTPEYPELEAFYDAAFAEVSAGARPE